MAVLHYLRELNGASILLRLALTMLLGGVIGIEREKNGRPAGLRTHILVCLGACMTSMIGIFVTEWLGETSDPMRIAAQVISGIGFLGVGTILVKEHDHITGLTTAAGLWTTAAIGIALGYGFYEGAFAGTIIIFLTTAVLYKVENVRKSKSLRLYVELENVTYVASIREWFAQEYGVKSFAVVSAKSGVPNNVGIETIIPVQKAVDVEKYIQEIQKKEGIAYALESSSRHQFSMWR